MIWPDPELSVYLVFKVFRLHSHMAQNLICVQKDCCPRSVSTSHSLLKINIVKKPNRDT